MPTLAQRNQYIDSYRDMGIILEVTVQMEFDLEEAEIAADRRPLDTADFLWIFMGALADCGETTLPRIAWYLWPILRGRVTHLRRARGIQHPEDFCLSKIRISDRYRPDLGWVEIW